MAKLKTRSPITDKPLRQPGQSLEEERQKLLEDKLEPYALMALFFVLIAALEWWKVWSNMPPNPILFTAVALCFLGFAAWRVFRALPRLRSLRQGIEGEKAVGQYLERLRAQGYQVFHDVMGPTFNVDHVLIGPAGVFTIETKTWSKPMPATLASLPIRGACSWQANDRTATQSCRRGLKPVGFITNWRRAPVDPSRCDR